MLTDMRLVLAALAFATVIHAQDLAEQDKPTSDNPRDLLLRVRDKVLDTVDRLPRYMCTQTIDRFRYEPATILEVSSCDDLFGKRKTQPWNLLLTSSDRIRLD